LGGLGGRNSPPGALGQLQPPGPVSKQEWLESRGFADERLAMGPACLINPIACAQMAADAIATLAETSAAAVEATTVAVVEEAAEGAARGAAAALFYIQVVQMGDDVNHGAVQAQMAEKTTDVKPRDAAGGAEHTSGARKSTEQDHQAGKARKQRDRGGEKGDKERPPPRRRPKGWKGPWP
jgi:hypothetical protein